MELQDSHQRKEGPDMLEMTVRNRLGWRSLDPTVSPLLHEDHPSPLRSAASSVIGVVCIARVEGDRATKQAYTTALLEASSVRHGLRYDGYRPPLTMLRAKYVILSPACRSTFTMRLPPSSYLLFEPPCRTLSSVERIERFPALGTIAYVLTYRPPLSWSA